MKAYRYECSGDSITRIRETGGRAWINKWKMNKMREVTESERTEGKRES
jgi:hypothetical protein